MRYWHRHRPGEKETHHLAAFVAGFVVGVVLMSIFFRVLPTSSVDMRAAAYTAGSGSSSVVTSANAKYIGNKNSYVFHKRSCSSVKQMNESNKVFFASRQDAISAGYHGCQRCSP